MSTLRYAFKYARIRESGLCVEIKDTTNYILDPLHVPITDTSINYGFKYYYPIPESVSSFDDFHGLWYYDADHTQLFEEGNV